MRCALGDVALATGAEIVRGDAGIPLVGVSTDTRTLTGGALFCALRGPRFDGNDYADEAARGGAAAVLLRGERGGLAPRVRDLPAETAVAVHADPRHALGELAAWHRGRLRAPVIGITGSCGKTTTKNVLIELLSSLRATVGSPSSFNNDIGVPHTLLLADVRTTEALVVEMGTSGPGEIARLCRIARPDVGVITNIGPSHLERLGTVEGVAREKGELAAALPDSGLLVLNADCRFTPLLRANTSAWVVTFSVEGEGDLEATDVGFHMAGTRFRLHGREVSTPLLGHHNLQNLLAALCVCEGLGISLDDVLPAVARLRGGRQRTERIELGDVVLLDDSYNANPTSARAAVRLLAGFEGGGRRVLVLGDMLDLGETAAELHHGVGVDAAFAGIDLLVLVGDLVRATAAGALEGGMDAASIVHLQSIDAARAEVPDRVRRGDVVLVKGSRAVGLERVVEALRERFRPGEA